MNRNNKTMLKSWMGLPLLLMAGGALLAQVSGRGRIDVESYDIQAEVVPANQVLNVLAKVRFKALEDRLSTVEFDFNEAMRVRTVQDGKGNALTFSRVGEFRYRLTLVEPLAKDATAEVEFQYDGRFDGREESPVYGIRFAAIENEGGAFLYPARWFPVNEYTADRYTMNLSVTVPAALRVISGGLETTKESSSKVTYLFENTRPAMHGSFAFVPANMSAVPVSVEGVTSRTYFRKEGVAQATGEMVAKAMNFLTDLYGLPPVKNLALVETYRGFPNGYSSPGVIFFSSGALQAEPNQRLIVNQVSRQWWGGNISAFSRAHIWLINGLARYSEALYIESTSGPSALEQEMRDVFVEALTQPEPPLIQAARYEDYSPEYWAATAGKGSAVLHMLRTVVGKDNFGLALKAFAERFAGKQAATGDFRRTVEEIAGQDLGYFFIQWIESAGAPEFRLTYTVFRTQTGFRIVGKVSQDLDTFRMPVKLEIETEGNPEEKTVEVVGTSSEFSVETFGKPLIVKLDPDMNVLRYDDQVRVAVAIRRGEQFAEVSEFAEALKEYQKALEVNRNSSLAHYRVAEILFLQNNYQSAANEFREVLNGDLEPKWTEVWSHINLGKIFDITGQRERAVSEYNQAIRTKDNTQGALEEAAKYLQEPYKRQTREL
jgi:aminopeptidase N